MPVIPLRALPQRATVLRSTSVSDGRGGWSDAFASVATGVPCRVAAQPAAARLEDGRMVADLSPVGWFLPTADVRGGDRLDVAGEAYAVQSVITQADGAYRKAMLGRETAG